MLAKSRRFCAQQCEPHVHSTPLPLRTARTDVWRFFAIVVGLVSLHFAVVECAEFSSTCRGYWLSVPRDGEPFATLYFEQTPLVKITIMTDADLRALQELRSVLITAYDAVSSGDELPLSAKRVRSGEFFVCWAGRPILEVSSVDAKRCNSMKVDLANLWIQRIRGAFTRCKLAIDVHTNAVAVGEVATFRYYGIEQDSVAAQLSPSHIADCTLDKSQHTVSVRALSEGDVTLTLSADSVTCVLRLSARFRAAQICDTVEAKFRGDVQSVPPLLLRQVVRSAIASALTMRRGCRVRIEVKRQSASSSAAPERVQEVKVQATAPQCLPLEREARVGLKSFEPLYFRPSLLWLSNDPEDIRRYQTLLECNLEDSDSARILLHHRNAMSRDVLLIGEVINTGSQPANFWLRASIAGPDRSEMHCGYVATRLWLLQQLHGVAWSLSVAPRSVFRVFKRIMRPGQTVSGLLEFLGASARDASGSGASVVLRLLAAPISGELDFDLLAISGGPATDITQHPWVVENPTKSLHAEYVVGGKWAFISVGRHPRRSKVNGRVWLGNYGVTYNIEVDVRNPTENRSSIEVVFHPTAGAACGVFVINRRLYTAPVVLPPDEYVVARFAVPAFGERKLRIVTMPLAGSNYPVYLILRSR